MKKSQNKNSKFINWIICISILLPLCYLVYHVNIIKPDASDIGTDTLSAITLSTDSSQIKLQKAIDFAKVNPNEINYINLSLEYYRNAKYKECIDASQKALIYNSKSYAAYNNMCTSFNQLGLWDDAIIAGKKALEIIPNDKLVTNNLHISMEGKIKQKKSPQLTSRAP